MYIATHVTRQLIKVRFQPNFGQTDALLIRCVTNGWINKQANNSKLTVQKVRQQKHYVCIELKSHHKTSEKYFALMCAVLRYMIIRLQPLKHLDMTMLAIKSCSQACEQAQCNNTVLQPLGRQHLQVRALNASKFSANIHNGKHLGMSTSENMNSLNYTGRLDFLSTLCIEPPWRTILMLTP